jgi:photosynthetic reaction center cytochrome c subunit
MRVIGALILSLGVCTAAVGQEPEKKPAGVPENVQVLTGLSLREIRAEMTMMSDALDVKCAHCHVAGDLASDANPNKIAARKMLRMTKSLNELYFGTATRTDGTSLGHVTCFTCHRGSTRPINSPSQLTTATK